MTSASGYWQDLTTTDIERCDRDATVLVLPVGAVEQHGPHLPLATDSLIARAIAAEALRRVGDGVRILILPPLDIGHSLEHRDAAGTLTLGADTVLETWHGIGASVASAGFMRLVILNAHGGQRSIVDLAAVQLRAEHGLIVARASYFSFGMPDGLFAADEVRLGIHGGEVETSLMLHIAPELVRREHLQDFAYRNPARADNDILGYEKPIGLGWLSEDLSADGVVGNAARADAQRGERYLEFLGGRLVGVCEELLKVQLPDSSAR